MSRKRLIMDDVIVIEDSPDVMKSSPTTTRRPIKRRLSKSPATSKAPVKTEPPSSGGQTPKKNKRNTVKLEPTSTKKAAPKPRAKAEPKLKRIKSETVVKGEASDEEIPSKKPKKEVKVPVKKLKELGTVSGGRSENEGETLERLASICNLPLDTTRNIIKLFEEEATIPFLVRYRKELIGHLSAEELRRVKGSYCNVKEFLLKRKWIEEKLKERGLLTPQTKESLYKGNSMIELEHFYDQYKVKREDKVEKAKSLGLEAPAVSILTGDRQIRLQDYVPNAGSLDEVKEGIMVILISIFSHDAHVLGELRELQKSERSRIECKLSPTLAKKKDKTKEEEETMNNFKQYFDFNYSTEFVKPYQVLAINRGVSLKVLTSKILLKDSVRFKIYNYSCSTWLYRGVRYPERTALFKESFERAYATRLSKFLERLIKSDLDNQAEEASLQVFANNLKWLLLAPPSRGETVLAIDPGYRHGCKTAVISPSGKFVTCSTLYLTSSSSFTEQVKLKSLIEKHCVSLVAIGNGKGRYEVEQIISRIIQKKETELRRYLVVSEQGLSIYSCSPEAAQEFPDMDPNMIGAISLGRRVLDPLCELVKVDPKHLGVGMYQHDVNKKDLSSVLLDVVSECVSVVGVDINTAPVKLLSHIAGLSVKKAESIIAKREQVPFKSRLDLKAIKGIGPKTFEQCAGFIRVLPESVPGEDPSTLNPLDSTDIHPESYTATKKLLKEAGADVKDLGKQSFIDKVKSWTLRMNQEAKAKELKLLPSQLSMIVTSLSQKRDYDCRLENAKPIYKTEVLSIDSLKIGQVISGRVQNVTQFGVFVDVGIERDGLIPNRFLKGAELRYGNLVEVKVLDIVDNKLSLDFLKVL